MGGGGGSNTNIQESPLPDWAADEVKLYLERAYALSIEPYVVYPGVIYSGRTYAETQGIELVELRGRNGSPLSLNGRDLLERILKGEKLETNVTNGSLDALVDATVARLLREFKEGPMAIIDQRAIIGNYYGGSGHMFLLVKEADKVAKDLQKLIIDIYGEDYFRARGDQSHAMEQAIPFGTEDVRDFEMIRMAGLYKREYEQGRLDAFYKAWLDGQESYVKKLNILGNAIKAMMGAQVSKTEPNYQPSPMSQIAGLAIAGMGAISGIMKGAGGYGSGPQSFASASGGAGAQAQSMVPGASVEFNAGGSVPQMSGGG